MDLIGQGRGWLQDGEAPEAVAEEALAQVEATSEKLAKGAWLIVAAEALCAAGKPDEALDPAGEALAMFKDQPGQKAVESAAACTFAEAHLAAMNWDDAISAATTAIDTSQEVGDLSATGHMFLQLAKAYLAQMKDPYVAARSALSAVEIFRTQGDQDGVGQGLQLAAEGYLLYDPEEALKSLKEASQAFDQCGNFKRKGEAQKLMVAARAHIGTIQQAIQATSMVSRGDGNVPYKWPRYAQQRGYANPDPYVVEDYAGPGDLGGFGAGRPSKKISFMRRAFKWTTGRHATDGAWYRQELHFVPPRIPQS